MKAHDIDELCESANSPTAAAPSTVGRQSTQPCLDTCLGLENPSAVAEHRDTPGFDVARYATPSW